jgi:acetyl-CoA acyltransferase
MFDTTIGWRFVNPLLKAQYGIDSMPETGENVAADFAVSREDQDAFALRSQQRVLVAMKGNVFAEEITPVTIATTKRTTQIVETDEHPRETNLEILTKLPTPFRQGGTVTAGNSSGVNDGSCAILLASQSAVAHHGLRPLARVMGTSVAGVPPRIMGTGPVPATRKILDKLDLTLSQMDVVELNEAFAAQALAVLRQLGLPDDAPHVNPNGGAIALGHPLGMSGARLVTTASYELMRRQKRYALCTMCIGVGQGIAMVLERA